MIIDFRYHIASLVAVFLALSLGILIGGAALGNNTLQEQLKQIDQQLAKMHDDQKVLEKAISDRDNELRTYDRFSKAVAPTLVRDRLIGKRIALVRTNPNVDQAVARDLAALFKTAGAQVMSTTTILRNPMELPLDKLTSLGAKLGISGPDAAAYAREILKLLAERIANGPAFDSQSGAEPLTSLSGNHLIEISGDYKGMVDAVILIGGSRDQNIDNSKQVDGVFLDAITFTSELQVAAVEPMDVAKSYLSEYLKHPTIIVVDNANTGPGQLALVLALQQGKKGHYGVKNAKQLMPDLSAALP